MSKSIFSLAVMAAMTAGAMAQTSGKPVIRHIPAAESQSHIMTVSDNGLWAVGQTSGDDGTCNSPRLLDVSAGTTIDLFTDNSAYGMACDVTDDGKLVAGSYQSAPALYYVDQKKWVELPLPAGRRFNDAHASAITPDGTRAIGYGYWKTADGMYSELPMVWDLTGSSPVLMNVVNFPDIDLAGDQASMVRLTQMSADGRYIYGVVDFSYPMTSWTFIYDMQDSSWKPLGYEYDGEKLNPDGMAVEDMRISPNGKYAAVAIYTDEGGEIGYYDLATGEVTVIPGSEGKMLGDIDNFGVVYASAPSIPLRDWSFYVDGYWFDWKLVLRQMWGIDWQNDVTKDDLGMSGTFVSASSDGLRLLAADYSGNPGGSFAMQLSKPLKELSAEFDPLANQMYFPTPGSTFSAVRNVTVYFDREIEVIGARDCVKLLDDKGEEVKSSMSVAIEAGQTRNLLVTFRNAAMEAGKTYTVVIPAGTVHVKGDASRQNKEIRISYVGRADEPVKPVKISPEDGTAMPRLSMSTNPVTVVFDAVLNVLDGGSIGLYRVNGGEDEFLYSLSSTIDGNTMTIYPMAEQLLAKGVTYKVVVAPNTVGDIAGNNGNEKIEVTYLGTYVPDINITDGVVFSEDFTLGLGQMMLYDGDQNKPVTEMADWGFNSSYPWWTARDSNETMEQSAVSHSMYTPAGKSDDWMVTPALYIPDETCVLTFDSQSYKKNKNDVLKVYVLACDDVYTAPITKSFIDMFKSQGELVYSERQNPGASEDLLDGDWTHNSVTLDKYAKKQIYVAFVNDNENQSAVFVDNVLVQRDLQFTIGVAAPTHLVDAESLPVSVLISVRGEDTYDDFTLRLLDGEDNLVEEKELTGLGLKKGDTYEYSFTKELPLAKGRVNAYSVEAHSGDKTLSLPLSVKNLRFQPERVVVIEEGTGTQCGYCPLGHRALELMDEIYGDKVIPVAVHSYTTGSEYLTSWTSDYGTYLGFTAYPTAVLNREALGSPLYSDGVNYFMNDPEGESTWFDYTNKLMSELAEAEVSVKSATIDPDKGVIEVNMDMRYAFDNDNANLNLHTVVLENGLEARQSNNVAGSTSSLLGDWGSGGKYGSAKPKVPFNHVARGMHGNSFAGVAGMFPRVIDSGTTYNKVYTFDIPRDLSDTGNAEVVVMLIDANSQKILTAAKAPCLVGVVGIDGVTDGVRGDRGDVYSITGVKVLENATRDDVERLDKGIYIFNGKKVMVR